MMLPHAREVANLEDAPTFVVDVKTFSVVSISVIVTTVTLTNDVSKSIFCLVTCCGIS